MKKILSFLLIFIFSFPLFSQDEDVLTLSRPSPEVSRKEGKSKLPLESRVETLWFVTLSHIKEQQFALAEADIKKIIEEGSEWEIKRFPPFAYASIGLFYDALKKKETLQAKYFLKFASTFDSKIPEIYLAKADFAWAQKSYISYFINLLKFLFLSLGNENYYLSFLNNLIILFFLLFLALLIIFTLFLLYKNIPKIKHDIYELFESKYNQISILILSLGLIFLPIALGLNWFWILAYFLIIIFGYAKPLERAIIIFLIVIQIIALPIFYHNLDKLYASFSPIIQSSIALGGREISYRYIPDIEIILGFVEEPDLIFLLGNLYEASGDSINAIAAYKKAIAIDPTHGMSYIGLANQYFWQQNYSAALSEYLNAQKYLPFSPLLYYNLSKAYYQNNEYNKGEEALNAGMAINSRQISKFISSNPPRGIVPLYLSPNQAWDLVKKINKKGLLKEKGIRGHENNLSSKFGIFHPYTIAFSLCLFLSIIFHLYRKKNWGYAGVCTKCGRCFCKKCKRASESQIYCTQCIHIYIKKDGVSLDTKVKKMKEVKRFLKQEHYLKKVFNLIIPGFGYLMEDKKLKGFMILLLFFVLLFYLIIPYPFSIVAFKSLSIYFIKKVSIFFMVLIWFLANVRVLIEKGGI